MADIRLIRASETIDPAIEGHYAFISSSKAAAGLHCHDFYEMFLVTAGLARHLVNGTQQDLAAGSLVFIRPSDAHHYQSVGSDQLNFINLAFTSQAAENCFRYLEGCLPQASLLTAPLPPHVCLAGQPFQGLIHRLENWNTIPLTAQAAKRAELRALLAEFFIRYLGSWTPPEPAGPPAWLTRLMAEMGSLDNLTAGLPALLSLSGKSHEHLCRAFRQYAGQTPTAFICGLRLDYAANLLVNSNLSVLDVMLASGFENLSHFNHRFRARYGCPPREFRKSSHRSPAV